MRVYSDESMTSRTSMCDAIVTKSNWSNCLESTETSDKQCGRCQGALTTSQSRDGVVFPFDDCTHGIHESCYEANPQESSHGPRSALLKSQKSKCHICLWQTSRGRATAVPPLLSKPVSAVMSCATSYETNKLSGVAKSFPGTLIQPLLERSTGSSMQTAVQSLHRTGKADLADTRMLALHVRSLQVTITPEFPQIELDIPDSRSFTALLSITVPRRTTDWKYDNHIPAETSAETRSGELTVSPPTSGRLSSFHGNRSITTDSADLSNDLQSQKSVEDSVRRTHCVLQDLKGKITDWNGLKIEEQGQHVATTSLHVGLNNETQPFDCHLFHRVMILVRRPETSKKSRPKKRFLIRGSIFIQDIESVRINKEDDCMLIIALKTGFVRLLSCKFSDMATRKKWFVMLQEQRYPFQKSPTLSAHTRMADDNCSRPTSMSVTTSYSKALPNTPTSCQEAPCQVGSECPSPFQIAVKQQDSVSIDQSIRVQSILSPSHIPMDIVVVAPIGISMKGLRLACLQDTLCSIIGQISNYDRLGIVFYGVDPALGTTIKLTRKTDLGPVLTAIKLLYVREPKDHEVDLQNALSSAINLFKMREARPCLSYLMLLAESDDASTRISDDLTKDLISQNLVVHTFGYGPSHDEKSLSALSTVTSGTYVCITEYVSLKAAMTGCLAGLMSVSHTEVNLILIIPPSQFTKSVRIMNIAGCQHVRIAEDRQSAQISLKYLCYGDVRGILVQLDFTDQKSHKFGNAFDLLKVTTYHRNIAKANTTTRLKKQALLRTSFGESRQYEPLAPIIFRRLELLVAETILRMINFISQEQAWQAYQLLQETRHIIAIIKRVDVTRSTAQTHFDSIDSLDTDLCLLFPYITSTNSFGNVNQRKALELFDVLMTQRSWHFGLATQNRYAERNPILRGLHRF